MRACLHAHADGVGRYTPGVFARMRRKAPTPRSVRLPRIGSLCEIIAWGVATSDTTSHWSYVLA
ncbi:hypothetical protein IA54_009720 [Xanthomonas phaseoli pv. syngonii LMG 9055]|uniref:Uncharacterized protein n=1 Tax=Xanthomonas phaseoli pv. syngonii LMG 9055 TaxID=1437878 RepID=A0A1V9GZP2_9XANT|nr:hypothetical protein IA54_009720 [Xanthomonas phaseoli pv. syngonii LMG 9055]